YHERKRRARRRAVERSSRTRMFAMRRICWLAGFVACAPLAAAQNAGPAVEVKVAKYPDLSSVIEANQGRVVLIDFWATTCVPCKQGFPHLLEMQRTYGGKGLVVLTVATDS